MGFLLTVYTISFILCVLYTLYLIRASKNPEFLEFCAVNGFGYSKLKSAINILSVGSVVPVFNTLFIISALYSLIKELFNGVGK